MEQPTLITDKKKKPVRKWFKDHKDTIIPVTLTVGITAAYVAVIVAAAKADQKQAAEIATDYAKRVAELTEWENELIKSGKVAWRLADGRFLVTEAGAAIETVIK